jgi:uncharacterized protein
MNSAEHIISAYHSFIANRDFACIAAKASLYKNKIRSLVVPHMACPAHDEEILRFLYQFVDDYRRSRDLFYSATIIFEGPCNINENTFDEMFWQRLQSLANLDAKHYDYDNRVSSDPASAHFSFSLKGEAFFIIGLHGASSRRTRRFPYPAMVFNPHEQFEILRERNRYEPMKKVVRHRDIRYSGSINPMLDDFGFSSEVYQYSGRQYNDDWKCPFHSPHGKSENNPTT